MWSVSVSYSYYSRPLVLVDGLWLWQGGLCLRLCLEPLLLVLQE
jgi:hypothetical protein